MITLATLATLYACMSPIGAKLAHVAMSDSKDWHKATRRARAEIMVGGALVWPFLVLILLNGWILLALQAVRGVSVMSVMPALCVFRAIGLRFKLMWITARRCYGT